ncbi:nitrogen fixation protein VnfA [bacterium BMS3Abin07]|nr:nitrogen fixation protein VnfA [bacterium BMS3Abin07]GBE31604.1 nitrogen fixation protein VnfA [bacterium BMS3Bbin05]HDO21716.1 GAF domain-containing protein [Nitrospirota bacterium]HDZ87071.1 GAF domain-containing protein [Nitrospirota bacterium]
MKDEEVEDFHGTLEKQNKKLSILYEISLTVSESLDLKAVLADVLQKIIEFMSVDAGVIYVINEDTMEMIPLAFRNLSDEVIKDLTEKRVKIGECMCGNIAQLDCEVIINEKASEDSRFTRVSLRKEGMEFYAGLPLKAKGKVVGVLCAITHRMYIPDTEVLDILRAATVPIGLAIENARLFEDIKKEAEDKNRYLNFEGIITNSNRMNEILNLVRKVLNVPTSLLIYGESGTGKELIARAIHYNSIRKDKPFIPINCAALPETLLESELFGYVKGAFTGAVEDKKGLLEAADEGTLFLDEVNSMSGNLQLKLLRFLQERTFYKVGSTTSRMVDLRIIAATNQNLDASKENGSFRKDLYYRLNVIGIELPPLRERREDIPLLSRYFINKYNRKLEKKIRNISDSALSSLLTYSWPGNIRELENTIERAIIITEDNMIKVDDLPPQIPRHKKAMDNWSLEVIEIEHIMRVLNFTEGEKKKAARLLGIDQTTLWRKLKKYNIAED